MPKYIKYLGPSRDVADQRSPKHGIRFNTHGLDEPSDRLTQKLHKKGAPDSAVARLQLFPEAPIGEWVDEAVDATLAAFRACNRQLAQKANAVSLSGLFVELAARPFATPPTGRIAAGAYFPSENRIQVVAFYWSEGQQWLRHCQDLLVWEFGNFYSLQCGVKLENADSSRPAGWPCN